MAKEMNIIETLEACNFSISTAESLTAGLVASNICEISGASKYFRGGIVAYTIDMKVDLLGVDRKTIDTYGVYSLETALEMALAIKNKTGSSCAIGTTGVAGPNNDGNVKAGTVYFGFVINDDTFTLKRVFDGDRNTVREKAAKFAVEMINEILNN